MLPELPLPPLEELPPVEPVVPVEPLVPPSPELVVVASPDELVTSPVVEVAAAPVPRPLPPQKPSSVHGSPSQQLGKSGEHHWLGSASGTQLS